MNKYMSIFLIIFLLVVGCDNIKKCYPKIDPKTGEYGFGCEGEF